MFSQCMADRSRLASHQIALQSRLAEEWNKNQADVYVLERDDLVAVWVQDQKNQGRTDNQIEEKFKELVGETALTLMKDSFQLVDDYGATVVAAAIDVKVLSSLGRDMQRSGNLMGQYKIRPHNGKKYIAFKGNHRLRSVVKGTRYGLKNPTIVKMGIGPDGLKQTAKGGVYVTLVISVGVNGLAWIFDEEFGWKDFLTNVSEDVVKTAIAAVAGYVFGAGVAAATGMAVLASAAGFVIALGVGFVLMTITPNDVKKFAEDASAIFHRSISILSNPKAYFDYQVQRAEDAAYCAMKSTGQVIVEGTENLVQQRVEDFLRSFSPFNIR